MSEQESRRGFVQKVTIGGTAAVLGSAAVAAAAERRSPRRRGRRVVGESGSAAPTGRPFSRAVAFDDIVFVAGVVGRKPGTAELASRGFEGQCRQAMDNLKASVDAAGSSMDKVLKCTCFLADAADFATFNTIYAQYFPSAPPARSTVIVKQLVVPGAKLEIDCVTCLR